MAYWDSAHGQIVYSSPRALPDYPGWADVDCGCCGGIEWGGEQPRECRSCGGTGSIARHTKTGTLALYPGGPLCGRESLEAQEVK